VDAEPRRRDVPDRRRPSCKGDLTAVLEAIKIENPVSAHEDHIATGLAVEPGSAITQQTVLTDKS
jgi:acetyl/propionyl-CoA carboxylase alpha subunit